MTGLDAGVVGDWLADADDAPIPLPWRGEIYYAPPPDGARGKRIAAYIALINQDPGEDDDESLRGILAGEPIEVLAMGRETYDRLTDAGMKGDALVRATNLCLVRWGYGSDEIARKYVESFTGRSGDPEDEPAPK